jgi:signal transduction histidine kinase
MTIQDMPIRRKLTLIILVTSVTAMLLLSVAFLGYQFITFRKATVRQLSTLGQMTAANSTAALAFDNPGDEKEILAALKAEPNIVAACIFDRAGQIFSKYPDDISDRALPIKPEPDGYRFENSFIEGYEPVAQGGNGRLGTLYLKFDTGAVTAQWLKTTVGIGAAVMAVVLLVAYLMSRSLQKRISQPILALADSAKAVSERGDYSLRVTRLGGDELGLLTDAFNRMLSQIQELNRNLEQRVTERTAQLENANKELESFSYSVSHDLRAPLRHIDGFAGLLAKNSGSKIDEKGQRYISTISGAAKQMGRLIDDLLAFSKTGRTELKHSTVDLDALVAEVIRDGRFNRDGRVIEWRVAALPQVEADSSLLRQVWSNLVENAVKYSSKVALPRIEIGHFSDPSAGEYTFFVRDNGVGFDMQYVDKLFGVFQRLHAATEFEGTGIGLANVRRIIARHGGRTWAEGAIGVGATIYFTLPKPRKAAVNGADAVTANTTHNQNN